MLTLLGVLKDHGVLTANPGPTIKGKVKNEVEVRTTYAFVALDVGVDDVLGVVVPINGSTSRAGVSSVPATSEPGVVGGRMVKTHVCKANVVGHAVDVDQMVGGTIGNASTCNSQSHGSNPNYTTYVVVMD